jgi:hypothetical protein
VGAWVRRRDERRGHGFSVDVDSLGVPMSPGLVNERMWALIAHGLISTERTRPQRTHAPAFLCIGCSRPMPPPFCVTAVQ